MGAMQGGNSADDTGSLGGGSAAESEGLVMLAGTAPAAGYDSGSLTASDASDAPVGEKALVAYSPPPDGGYGWVMVVCCFVLEFFAEGPISAFGVFQNYYVNERFKGHASNSTISLVGVLNSSCMAILGVVSGKLCERYGYRTVPTIGVCLLSLGYLLASFAREWFERRRGLATGIVNLGIGTGGIVWTQFDHLLIRRLSVAWALRITSIVVFIVCMSSLMLIRTYQTSPVVVRTSLRSLRNRGLMVYLAAAFFTGISSLVPFFYLPGYAADIGISPSGGALITSVANGASLAGRVAGTVLSDALGPIAVLLGAYALTTTSMLLIWTTTHNFAGTMAFGIVFGLGYGATFTQTSAFVAKYFGVDTLPVFVGMYYTVSGIGYLFGPPIAGVILEKTRSWGAPYIALKVYAGVPMAVASVAIILIKLSSKRGL